MRELVAFAWWLLAASSATTMAIHPAAAAAAAAAAATDEAAADDSLLAQLPGEAEFRDVCLRRPGGGGAILETYLHRHLQAVDYIVGAEGRAVPHGSSSDLAPKFFVWRCQNKSHIGGIGDRIKRLGGLFTTAIVTGRVLLFDFDDFSDAFGPARHGTIGSSPVEWRFSELESGLRERAPVWWEYGGEHEDFETTSADGRPFANLTTLADAYVFDRPATVAHAPGPASSPSSSSSSSPSPSSSAPAPPSQQDFTDDVRCCLHVSFVVSSYFILCLLLRVRPWSAPAAGCWQSTSSAMLPSLARACRPARAYARACTCAMFRCLCQVIFTDDGGSLPYLFGAFRDHSVRDAVEGDFPEGFFEGCVFHALFAARPELRQMYHHEVRACVRACLRVGPSLLPP
jgi:hypothetical protein